MREIDQIVIHCSASNSHWYDFKAIRKDHVESRLWKDIGYHYGIDYDGKLHILRPVKKPGAHVKNYNFTTIGVCLLGYKIFSDDQFETLARLLKNLKDIFNLTNEDIVGHNYLDYNKTCPTFDVEAFKQKYMEA